MRKSWRIALLSGALLAGVAGAAAADSRIGVHISLGAPAPVYYPAPHVVYAPPAPAYFYPPYYPPAVYYSPAPRVVYYDRPYDRPHWKHYDRHHRHGHGHRDWR